VSEPVTGVDQTLIAVTQIANLMSAFGDLRSRN
jgi:hypothetical protein